MADKRDYYEVLGVPKTATDAEIKSTFRKKAKECHPDLHPGDKAAEAQFKELNEAAEILSDPDKRKKYDQFGHAAFDPSMGGQNPFEGGFSGFGGFSDIIDQMFGGGFSGGGFGGGQTRNGPAAGNDLRYSMTLTFDEAAFGVRKEILVPREENCAACSGTGAKPGTTPERCPTCGGSGQVRTQQNTILGSFTSTRPCTNCRGTGKVIKDPCPECHGAGRVRKNTRIAVNVPAGIDNGQTISMRGEGEAGARGGPRGDLYITITVRPHKLLTRKGFDLYQEIGIPYTVATLGGEITVPTLKESVKYTVPAGTQSGATFRLRDQGVQRLNGTGRGDLLVTVRVDVPKRLTEEQRALLEQFATAMGEDQPRTGKKSFFKRENRTWEPRRHANRHAAFGVVCGQTEMSAGFVECNGEILYTLHAAFSLLLSLSCERERRRERERRIVLQTKTQPISHEGNHGTLFSSPPHVPAQAAAAHVACGEPAHHGGAFLCRLRGV